MAKNLGLVLYENVQPMDVIGPWEVLAMWKKVLHAPIEMSLISENGGLVKCDDDIVLAPIALSTIVRTSIILLFREVAEDASRSTTNV